MIANAWALPFLNKWLAAMPIILLVACDGSRGNDGTIALLTTGFLITALTLSERLHFKARTAPGRLRIALLNASVAVFAFALELFVLEKMGALQGPIGVYGWQSTLTIITVLVFALTVLAALADHKALQRR